MRPVRQAPVNSVTTGPVIAIDWRGSYPEYTVGVALNGSVLTYTVEYTLDDVFDPAFTSAGATWYPSQVAALVAATTSKSAVLQYPMTGMRLNVTAYTSGPGASLTLVSANDGSA